MEKFSRCRWSALHAEDLACQVSTEAQDGLRRSNFVTGCPLGKKFFEEDFTLRSIDPRRIGFAEESLGG